MTVHRLPPFLATVAGLILSGPLDAQVTTRVSLDPWGTQADRNSSQPSFSANGRYVGFTSFARNLVPFDTNGIDDAFVKDRRTGQVTRISVDSAGNQGNAWTGIGPKIAANGRWAVYSSASTNLVAGDTNGQPDVFKHDLWTGVTTRVSVADDGSQADAWCTGAVISDDGNLVMFTSSATTLVLDDINGVSDVFLHDAQIGTLTRISVDGAGNEGDGHSRNAEFSSDATSIVFESEASNLVAGDTNGFADIFRLDRNTGTLTRLTNGNGDSRWPSYSADGNWIAFISAATDLVPGDTNGKFDVFLMDSAGGNLQRISVHTDGSQADGDSLACAVSGDGSRVAFDSFANNLADVDTNSTPDIFLREVSAGVTRMVSVSSAGLPSNGVSFNVDISRAGRHVGFDSTANNLVANDTLPWQDVFVHGSELILEASADQVAAGDNLDLDTWAGTPGDPALLYVSAVDGALFLFKIHVGSFDGAGLYQRSFTVPNDPTLSGLTISFVSFALAPRGAIETTNEVDVDFL